MRALSRTLRDHLAGQATTMARAWRLTRRDGTVLGFTDHDGALAFAGTRFEAASGFSAGEAERQAGLASGSQEVEGALSSEAITAEDIAAGRYNGARVEIFAVNWQAPGDHVLLDTCELGEVRRGETGFAAELRGAAAAFDRVRGRLYRRRCDAVFGDPRCGLDIRDAPFAVERRIAGADGSGVVLEGVPGEAADWTQGRILFLDGAAEGLSAEILVAAPAGEARLRLTLLAPVEADVAAGGRARVSQGCDKRFETCRDRFANHANFRGFPHLPGGDEGYAIAKKGGVHDGSPLVP